MPHSDAIIAYFQDLQDRICQALSAADGTPFREDLWERPGGGGGRTRVIEGQHIEKGGVNFSAVHGELSEQVRGGLGIAEGRDFLATGVSIVLHPRNPHVPIIHMNVRYFELDSGLWWFGGGIDLTPHYVVPADAAHFHRQLAEACARHGADVYPRFKAWADRYFYLKHRQETRGVGGIFFDRLGAEEGHDKASRFAFVREVGELFAPLYLHFLQRHRDAPHSDAERAWQMLRRGRYVEFNLVWDRGTKFGLDTEGRTESILMSLPPVAHWAYQHQPAEGSPEAETLQWLRQGVDWLALP